MVKLDTVFPDIWLPRVAYRHQSDRSFESATMPRKVEQDGVPRSDDCLEQVELVPELFAVAIMNEEHLHSLRLQHKLDCFSVWHRIFETIVNYVVTDADNECNQMLQPLRW